MSFDLLFVPPDGQSATAPKIAAILAKNQCFEVLKDQAVYENPETGVHFMLEFGGEPYANEDEEAGPEPDLILQLNYLRPSPFVNEAADIADLLVAEFGFEVVDPQEEGELRPWDRARFLASYRKHAEMVAKSFAQNHAADFRNSFRPYPSNRLEEIWKWNRQRNALGDRLWAQGRDLYVPTIMVFEVQGALYEAIVWGDAVPSLMPPVEYILLLRDELAPKQGILRRRKQVHELVPRSALEGLLEAHYRPVPDMPGMLWAPTDAPDPRLRRDLSSRRAGLDSLIAAFSPDAKTGGNGAETMSVVPFSSLIDAEWVA